MVQALRDLVGATRPSVVFAAIAGLQWISDGCRDGAWSNFSYKTTAYALVGRGLVVVNRRRKQWTTTVTPDGEFYLAHGRYRRDRDDPATRADAASGQPDGDITGLAEGLITELKSGNGNVVVQAPSQRQRARCRTVARAVTKIWNAAGKPPPTVDVT
ncbi:MAG: hypothetical protein ACRDTS_14500 [Mycobacterium sp.]